MGTGYSGMDIPTAMGKNNPAMQDVPDVGPIPEGLWKIGSAFDSQIHGPVCMRLTPAHGTDTFGRSGFLIHGDSFEHPGEASEGCIVLGRMLRLAIVGSGDDLLQVVTG